MEIQVSSSKKFLWFIFVIVAVLILQYPYLNEFPSYTHAWAQADRYALAIGFLRNHFDFFHPQTYNLNPQFPGWFAIPNDHGITAVDFPIVEYVVALLMKLTGHTDPWCFRLIMLALTCTGLFYIYKLALLYLKQGWKAACVCIAVATSPVFTFYQSGYLPSISGVAFVWMGLYFYFLAQKETSLVLFRKAIFFLAIASLIRTPATTFLIAVTCYEVLLILTRKNKISWSKVWPVGLSFLSIGAYAIYNAHLRKVYGSIFLAEPVPAKSWEKAKEVISDVIHQWPLHYFTIWHYVFFALILGATLGLLVAKKIQVKALSDPLFSVSVISFFGALLYGGLMLKQFVHHDYYFIDTFFTPIFLLFIFLLSLLPSFDKLKWVGYAVVLCGVVLMVKDARAKQLSRRMNWDKTDQVRCDFRESASFLDSLQISRDAKITVIDAGAPNLAFILLERKGYAIINTSPSIIETILTWDAEAIVIEDVSMNELLEMYPLLLTELRCVGDNGRISVYKRRKYIVQSQKF